MAGQRGYDAQDRLFPSRESWRGIEIYRIGSTRLGKATKWRRAIDFATFLLNCTWRVFVLPRHDAIVALTSPPLISFLGAWLAVLKRSRFYYWVMDLNPDEAVAAGWLRGGSLPAIGLEWLSRFSMRRASRILVLDRFVKERITAKGIPAEKVVVIPTWSLDDAVQYDLSGRQRFRSAHGLTGKFVVMYSGNHSPCHPLDTVLEAARALAQDPEFVFLFVGGGSGWKGVGEFARQHRLTNVQWLPYQPLDQLSASLSAADVQIVVMGDPFVGIIHPCKIYNILKLTASSQTGPVVFYVGPKLSHVSEVLEQVATPNSWLSVRHGDIAAAVQGLQEIKKDWKRQTEGSHPISAGTDRTTGPESGPSKNETIAAFARAVLLPRMIAIIASEG